MLPNSQNKTGDCETCDKTNVNITLHYGNTWMCDECWDKEKPILEQQKSAQQTTIAINKLAEESRQIDEQIEVKTDLFNAATVAFVELKAAIDNDPNIPAEQKSFAYAQVLHARFIHFKKILFEQREQLAKTENTVRAFQSQLQVVAGQLRQAERDKLQIESLDYKPREIKTPKPPSEKKPRKSSLEEFKQAIVKYGLPSTVAASTLAMLANQKNMSADEAAKMMKDLLEGKK